jgi:dipeptidyl aminopeptidase/acylaminoacyl peptidase
MDDVNIWRAEAPAAMAHTMKPGSQIIASTRTDIHPQYSWDGKRIVFVSDRDGTYELWMCAADGSNPVQLTSFGGHRPGPPHWSPDSQQVVFDLDTPGSYDVYVVGTDGGGPRRLTERGWRPSWSHDGRWIYFCSDRSSSSQQRFTDGTQIWKIPVERDEAVQVTKGGGCEPVESPDGKTLFFQRGRGHLALWSMPGSTDAEGGSETPILPSVLDGYWAVADQGVYFISPKHWAVPFPVLFFSFETRRATQIGTIGKDLPVDPSFSVTPDGHWIIWAQVDRSESDLMLVENFQ